VYNIEFDKEKGLKTNFVVLVNRYNSNYYVQTQRKKDTLYIYLKNYKNETLVSVRVKVFVNSQVLKLWRENVLDTIKVTGVKSVLLGESV